MKRLLVFISAIALSLSFLTGCSVELNENFLGSSFSFEANGNISTDYGITSSGNDTIGKHDISDSALDIAEDTVEEDGVYTTPAMVAAYIHIFNKLPSNYITKKEAQQLGWNSSKNYISDVAPGKSIGGDNFGNREGLLPKGKYKECDINYKSGKRNAERIIYNTDGDIYYTDDHYNSFTKLYGEGEDI